MKRFYLLIAASLFALISCNKEDAIKTPSQNEFNTTHENLEFDARGGKVTMQIPFDDYYLHYVLNQDSMVFFYLKEKNYDQLGSILKRRDIVVEPDLLNLDPEEGFSYFEWEWFTIELKDHKVQLSIQPNETHEQRTGNIRIPRKVIGNDGVHESLDIRFTQEP